MKLSLIVAVVCLVACVFADDKPEDHQKCTPLQRIKVRRQWDKAFGEGSHRLEFAQHFFSSLFKHYPESRKPLAKYRSDNIYSPEFQAYGQRVLNGIGMIIDTADDPEANKVIIAKQKVHNTEMGIDAAFYTAFRDELMETLPEFLDTHFDWDAWMGCLNLIISGLK